MAENKVTDYGEEYNRESMYETARELLIEGKALKMNGKTHKSLFTIMMEDYAMEIDKEAKYLRQAEKHLKADDDRRFLDSFAKTIARRKITDKLQTRLENTIEDAKKLLQYHKYTDKQFKSFKDAKKMTIEELNDALELLKEYKNSLLFELNSDCVTKATYKAYTITQKYIKEIEDELTKRQASVNL